MPPGQHPLHLRAGAARHTPLGTRVSTTRRAAARIPDRARRPPASACRAASRRIPASVLRGQYTCVRTLDATLGIAVQSYRLPVARSDKVGVADHHSVYVVYLKDPKGDGRAAYYVGM